MTGTELQDNPARWIYTYNYYKLIVNIFDVGFFLSRYRFMCLVWHVKLSTKVLIFFIMITMLFFFLSIFRSPETKETVEIEEPMEEDQEKWT